MSQDIAAIGQALDQHGVLQRGRQPQHRAFVKPRALGQRGQSQWRVVGFKHLQQAQRPVHGGHATRGSVLVRHGGAGGFAGHGLN